jgi:ribokinase
MIATSRILCDLRLASIELEALVGRDRYRAEAYNDGPLPLAPRRLDRPVGANGGYLVRGGRCHRYAPIPAPVVGDTYGAGDTFAAALTFALGERKAPAAAIAFASARAAEVVAFHGPYP